MPTLPTVHLNGTSRKQLLDAYYAQYYAIDTALKALQDNNVLNARDYYPQGDRAFAMACEEQEARFAALRKVRDEIYAICEALDV